MTKITIQENNANRSSCWIQVQWHRRHVPQRDPETPSRLWTQEPNSPNVSQTYDSPLQIDSQGSVRHFQTTESLERNYNKEIRDLKCQAKEKNQE